MTVHIGPRDVPDLVRGMASWWASAKGAAYVAHYLDTIGGFSAQELLGIDDKVEGGLRLCAYHNHLLTNAELFYVSADMEEYISQAAPLMPSDLRLEPEDLPAEDGFMVLESPLAVGRFPNEMVEIVGSEVAVTFRVIAWRRYQKEDETPFVAISLMDSMLDTGALAVLIEDYHSLFGFFKGFSLLSMLVIDLTMPVDGLLDDDQEAVKYEQHMTAREIIRWVSACWLLMGHRIAVSEPLEADRAERRRAQRADREPDAVTVIALRRASHTRHVEGDGDSVPRDWSHRWLVRGHWRSIKDASRPSGRRSVWVSEHVKGPDDKPLVLKDRVYALRR